MILLWPQQGLRLMGCTTSMLWKTAVHPQLQMYWLPTSLARKLQNCGTVATDIWATPICRGWCLTTWSRASTSRPATSKGTSRKHVSHVFWASSTASHFSSPPATAQYSFSCYTWICVDLCLCHLWVAAVTSPQFWMITQSFLWSGQSS